MTIVQCLSFDLFFRVNLLHSGKCSLPPYTSHVCACKLPNIVCRNLSVWEMYFCWLISWSSLQLLYFSNISLDQNKILCILVFCNSVLFFVCTYFLCIITFFCNSVLIFVCVYFFVFSVCTFYVSGMKHTFCFALFSSVPH